MTFMIGQSSKVDHYDKIIYGRRCKSYKRVLRPEQNPFCDPPFTKGVQYYHEEDDPRTMGTCFRPYEFMSRAERIATSERENWDPATWDAINWRWRQPPPEEDPVPPAPVDFKQEAIRRHLGEMNDLRRSMVVSNDKWEREKQQKDFETREEMILDSKAMYGRAILEDTPFNPWVKDYIRVDRCCLHFTCGACEEAGGRMTVTAIPFNLNSLREHMQTPQHNANEVLWMDRHPGRRRSNWKPPQVRVDTFGAAVNSVAVDDTFGVAIAGEEEYLREMRRRAAAAHDERALEQRQRRKSAGMPAWQPAARVSASPTVPVQPAPVLTPAVAAELASTPFPTPRTLPTTPRMRSTTPRQTPATQPPLPAAPLPPQQPPPVLWYETPDHYRTRMQQWYGRCLPGTPPTPATHCPYPYPAVEPRSRRGIYEHERDVHFQIRVEAYNRVPFVREPLFRPPPAVPPPATAHVPATNERAPDILQAPGFGTTHTLSDVRDDVPSTGNGVAWEPPPSRYDEGATATSWGPAHTASRPIASTSPPADVPAQPRRNPIVQPALPRRRRTPPDLAALQQYTCPQCHRTFDGLNSFPPIAERVNEHLRTIGSPELSHLEKSYIHRRWWGSHDCEDRSYVMFYLNAVFEWRGD